VTALLQGAVARQRAEAHGRLGRPAGGSAEPPREASERGLRARFRAAGDAVLGCVVGIVNVGVQCLLYAAAILAVPFLLFLLPLFLLPIVLLFDALILGAGAILTALGLP
jgi:hypothetical protein